MSRLHVFYRREPVFSMSAPDRVDPKDYEFVVTWEFDSVEDAFRRMNVVDGDEDYELPLQLGVRSMSSGDVLVDEAGRGHYCAPVGWVSVDVSGFEAVKGHLNCDRLGP